MDDDWAETDGDGALDLSSLALPEVKVPDPPAPTKPVVPAENAWTRVEQSSDVRRPVGDARAFGNPRSAPPGIGNRRQELASPSPSHEQPRGRFGFGNGGHGSGGGGGGGAAATSGGSSFSVQESTLYMTSLPSETSETEIAGFFSQYGVTPGDVRLTYHSDTGKVKAALIRLRDPETAQSALGMNGRQLGGRTPYIKIDGSDRRNGGRERGGGFSSGNYQLHGSGGGGGPPGYGDGGRERRSYGSSGFGTKNYRDGGMGGEGPGSGGYGGRRGYGGANGQFEPAGTGMGGGRDRDDFGGRDRRGPIPQAADPTIPEGPPPEGRKRLQLKPRTKPMPKLDIDKRAIEPTGKSSSALAYPKSAPVGGARDTRSSTADERGSRPQYITHHADATNGSADDFRPVQKGEGAAPASAIDNGRGQMSIARPGARDADAADKPVLANAFDALAVDDAADE